MRTCASEQKALLIGACNEKVLLSPGTVEVRESRKLHFKSSSADVLFLYPYNLKRGAITVFSWLPTIHLLNSHVTS